MLKALIITAVVVWSINITCAALYIESSWMNKMQNERQVNMLGYFNYMAKHPSSDLTFEVYTEMKNNNELVCL